MIGPRLQRLIPPLSARDPHEEHRAASPLELFTDLCYVVAIAQAALELHHAISEQHATSGLLHFLMAFFAIWWAWLNFAWFNSAYDPDDVVHRLLTLLQIFGSLVVAAGIGDMFHDDFTLGITGYVIMRIGLIAMWLRAARGHREGRTTALRYGVGLLIVQAGWVGSMLATDGHLPTWLIVLLVIGEFGVPVFAESAGASPWHPHHIAERYGLFFIIVLGETILSVTMALREAFDEAHPPAELWYVIAGGVLITFGSWWLYFRHEDAEVLGGEGSGNEYVWGFGHYVIFGAAAAVGAGLAARIDYLSHHGHATEVTTAAFITVPVAVLIAALWVVMERLHDHAAATAVGFGLAVVACVAVTWTARAELWTGLIVAVLLAWELRPRIDAE